MARPRFTMNFVTFGETVVNIGALGHDREVHGLSTAAKWRDLVGIWCAQGGYHQAGAGAGRRVETQRVLWHFDHAWDWGKTSRHDASGDAGADVQFAK